ncbi:MAG: deoxyguanosinetriphosphate triphosphohydrolase [Planctomycetaceae bacterium]|nr:deoxyguanosinetriphosphate triphosphohydrolase [Planctomycetaceae bacterium]
MSHLPLSAADLQAFEDSWLAPYAMPSRASRGRRHPEPAHDYRSLYQRDRERVVHCTAFRRMTGKTQVLVASVNDHHRTRLTHTLEVTQIARTVARRLRLNEDLTEAIALAHDIGHPPFGHAGEDALDACLKEHGGFDHNLFGLRRVDELEERYPQFPGLNLSFEVREAFVQHSGRFDAPECAEFRGCGRPLLEAQVVDVVDSLAYDTHDCDDALGLGFITMQELARVEFWARATERVHGHTPGLSGHPLRVAVVRELLAWQVTDLLHETVRRIQEGNIRSPEDVRAASEPLVGFTPEVRKLKAGLERFLRERVYRHHRVLQMTANGKRVLQSLFAEYVRSPELMPEKHLRRWVGANNVIGPPPPDWVTAARKPLPRLESVVGDYLAGMTDRYAQLEYRRLFLPSIEL